MNRPRDACYREPLVEVNRGSGWKIRKITKTIVDIEPYGGWEAVVVCKIPPLPRHFSRDLFWKTPLCS